MGKTQLDAGKQINKSFRSYKNKSSYSSKDTGIVGTLPVLVIATSLKPSNLHVCLEKWQQHVLLNYGEIGSIFSELCYPKPSAPELPAAEDLANDDTGLIRSTYLEKLKVFEKRKEDIRSKKIPVFALIYGQMSEESKQVASRDDKYEETMLKMNNPLKLLKILNRTHITSQTGIGALDRKTSKFVLFFVATFSHFHFLLSIFCSALVLKNLLHFFNFD